MVESELGEWRRTHYSKDLDASMEGSEIGRASCRERV